MLKAFFISFLIVTIIAFVILLFIMVKFLKEHELLNPSTLDAEEEKRVIQEAIDSGDFLACFMDDWASAIKVVVVIDIVLAIMSLL
jgi:hypothetical protein